MKHTTIGYLPRTCAAWLMVAAAPLAGAQSPSQAAGAPPPATAPGADAAPAPSPAQAGYLFGLTYGEQLHSVGVTDQVAIDDIVRGMKDGLQGKRGTPADRHEVQEFVGGAVRAATTTPPPPRPLTRCPGSFAASCSMARNSTAPMRAVHPRPSPWAA